MGSINPLDLPRLRDEPTFETLVSSLESLALNPSTWTEVAQDPTRAEDPATMSRYLTSVLKNPFEWLQELIITGEKVIPADDQRELLWNMASQRITERCGRTAMGEISRTWTLSACDDHPNLNILIREPSLTGDNLGLKTWGTAWAISQKIVTFRKDHFSHLLDVDQSAWFTDSNGVPFLQSSKPRILELGAGTGLLGLAAAAAWGTDVTLTDLDVIRENLQFNAQLNAPLIQSRGANVVCDVLDWMTPETGLTRVPDKRFEIIIASDPLYGDEHPSLVAKMINMHLKPSKSSRALVAVPMRDENTIRMMKSLQEGIESYGLSLLHEGTEVCRDDWASNGAEVRCWWGIWCSS